MEQTDQKFLNKNQQGNSTKPIIKHGGGRVMIWAGFPISDIFTHKFNKSNRSLAGKDTSSL